MDALNESPVNASFVAVVGGSTGATGRWIVGDLVNRPECSKVIALTRSEIPDPSATFPSADKDKIASKLIVHKVDWQKMNESGSFTPALPVTPTVGFCAMGSAPYTEESDFTMPVAFGKCCKALGVKDMFLVSSVGAKAGSWFGYIDTLGRREEAFKALSFDRLLIVRPGMMDRQEKKRFPKEYFKFLMPSSYVIDTRDIARVMTESAIRMKVGTHEFSHDDMKKIAATLKK